MQQQVSAIAIVYATLIVKGLKTFKQVPDVIKGQVKIALEGMEMGELAIE